MSVPIVVYITKEISSVNIARAAIETLILIFVWAIGFMMVMFGIHVLKKDFIEVFDE